MIEYDYLKQLGDSVSDFHPEWFGGNEAAARLIEDLCFVAHIWDDLIDQDKPVAPADVNRAFETALVSIPGNPFYQAHRAALHPLIFVGVIGYLAANRMESSGDAHQIEIAHGLRYAVAQVAAYAVAVTNSREQAQDILPCAWKAWMPERFADYAKEHQHAV